MNELGSSPSSDRYDRFLRKRAAGAGSGPPLDPIRLRRRYEAIYAANRELFEGARVLDLTSSSGFWSLAALDAGAAQVTGVEASAPAIEAAKKAFGEYGIDSSSYRFINSEAPGALRKFDPKAFDVVQCHGFLEQSDPRFVFQQLSRLRARHVILDTRLSQGKGPIVRFRSRTDDDAKTTGPERYKSILAIPNHELIKFFCDYFQFGWRVIDWEASGLTDWTGMNDYEQDRRRTYILERSAADLASRAS
jgi:16S rRNA G966 N2-methylase RsmD